MKNKPYKINDSVYWKWLGRNISGSVVEIHLKPVTKTIKDKKIKRNGSPDCPAYLVKSEAGNLALKLHTELFLHKPKSISHSTPKIFSK